AITPSPARTVANPSSPVSASLNRIIEMSCIGMEVSNRIAPVDGMWTSRKGGFACRPHPIPAGLAVQNFADHEIVHAAGVVDDVGDFPPAVALAGVGGVLHVLARFA